MLMQVGTLQENSDDEKCHEYLRKVNQTPGTPAEQLETYKRFSRIWCPKNHPPRAECCWTNVYLYIARVFRDVRI